MNRRNLYIVLIIILLSVFLYLFDVLTVFDLNVQDNVYQTEKRASDEIVLVGIDEYTWEKLGKWPLPREVQTKVFENIAEGNPAVLALDILYDSYTEGDTLGEIDKELIGVLSKVNTVCMRTAGEEEKLKKNNVLPFNELNEVVNTGYVNPNIDVNLDQDSVVRKTRPFLYLTTSYEKGTDKPIKDYIPSFSYQIYNQYVKELGLSEETVIKYDKFTNPPLKIDFYTKPNGYDTISFYDVYNGDYISDFFEDKIVFVGPYCVGMMDEYYTPLDNANKMFGVEIHANIVQNYMNDSFKKILDVSDNGTPRKLPVIIIIFAFIGLTFLLTNKMKPLKAAFINIGIIIIYILLAKIFVYNVLDYVIPIVYPVSSIVFTYVATLGLNYFEQMKERKRVEGIFGKYVAPQIVEKILEKGEENLRLGGTRRFISVLFVDIRGFTPLSEKCQPEEIVQILNEYLDLCAASIFNNGGTLDKFIGDATMAIFNAPLELEDHAYKAVKTAWEMKCGADILKENLQKKYGRTVDFGIGVNTGYAVVGNIGSKRRMDYTAIGDTVNTSARLESNAKPGQILISDATYQIVKDKIDAIPLGGLKVKGKSIELQVYQVEGLKD